MNPSEEDTVSLAKQENQVQCWQKRTSSEPEQQTQGIVARIFNNCRGSLHCLVEHLDSIPISKADSNTLRRCLSSLTLWAEGHHVETGALDAILDRSKSLRLATLSILNPMCKIISQGMCLMEQVQASKSEEAIKALFFDATELYSQTRWLLTDTNDDISDSESDSGSSCADDAIDKVHELAQSVKVYNNCLIDLGTALECPALEPEYDDGPSVVMWEQRTAHDYHTDLIKAKFPQAEQCLLQSLGQISWNRYQRLQHERDSNAVAQSALIPGDKSLAAFSEFKDSGLGWCIQHSTRHIRSADNHRKHLYVDLRPYTCVFASCSFTQGPFATRQLWSEHLELEHRLGPVWNGIQCPLCLDTTESGKSAVLIHFARHMENIALASLPRDVESDAECESDVGS
ncbi:hypothetical protein EJ07DRAFT_122136, partial [Lizonia empirigonia]